MATLEARISALEAVDEGKGPLLFSWRLDGTGRTVADVGGTRIRQEDAESPDAFLSRVGKIFAGRRVLVWLSEEDWRL